MVEHRFVKEVNTSKGKKLVYGTFIDGAEHPTITATLILNKAFSRVEIDEINALGYERSDYKYQLVKYIKDDFDTVCSKFDSNPVMLTNESYSKDELKKYSEISGMNEWRGIELCAAPLRETDKQKILSLIQKKNKR